MFKRMRRFTPPSPDDVDVAIYTAILEQHIRPEYIAS